MSKKSPPFIDGLAKGTNIFTSNGDVIPIEEIKVGSLVLSSDGSYSTVASIQSGFEEVIQIKQSSCHSAQLRDENRAPPWCLIKLGCSGRQRVQLRTKQRVKKILKKLNNNHVVEITQLRDHVTEDDRKIQILRTTSRQFSQNTAPQTIQEYIDSLKVPNGFIT